MPFVVPAFGQSNTDTQGMTRQLVIEMADKRTGHVGRELDLNGEFLDALQTLCMEHWWWWRKKLVQWTTEPTIGQYDLADPDSPVSELDVHKVIKVILYNASGQQVRLDPIFDSSSQIDMLTNPGSGQPWGYFIIPGTLNQVCLYPAPDQAYPVWLSFWALPNVTQDRLDDKIPLVPGYLHRLITLGMECNILRSKIGADSKKYMVTQALYAQKVEDANQTRNFADGDKESWASHDDAVRSTH